MFRITQYSDYTIQQLSDFNISHIVTRFYKQNNTNDRLRDFNTLELFAYVSLNKQNVSKVCQKGWGRNQICQLH